MTYKPQPIDTRDIELGPVGDLTEFLAKQVHEAWSARRMSEGWTHGSERDDSKKQAPGLVPYEALSEAEKDYDRTTLTHTLKLVLLQGYRIVPPSDDHLFFSKQEPVKLPESEMVDAPEDVAKLPQTLGDRLSSLNAILGDGYKQWDTAARHFQRKYLLASLWCTISVVLAIVLAVYQVAGYPAWGDDMTIPLLEFILVAFAVVLVLRDQQHKWKDNWLLNRSRAERMRGLKFRTLLDPRFWQEPSRQDVEAEVRKEVGDLGMDASENLPAWLESFQIPAAGSTNLSGNRELDEAICGYYFRERLISQANHATAKAHQHQKKDERTKIYGKILFFGVLFFVFSHVLIDFVVHEMHRMQAKDHPSIASHLPEQFSRILAVLAALVPAFGATLHIYRSGRESGRNHLRMKALGRRLGAIRMELERPSSLERHLRMMARCETALADEQQQWLHLMKECEWYG